MPSITPSDGDWIAEEAIKKSLTLRAVQGQGMQIKFDAHTLRTLSTLRPGDAFHITYSVEVDGTPFKAELSVQLSDPHGLFTGHSIVAVLGNLVSQIVEHRLAEPAPFPPPGWTASSKL